jgi:hypothetical protein
MNNTIPIQRSYLAHENTDKVVHLIIPAKPTAELSEEDLGRVAAGVVPLANGPWAPWAYWGVRSTKGVGFASLVTHGGFPSF